MTPRTRVVLALLLAVGLAPRAAAGQPALFLESESLLAARRWAPGFAHERDIEQCRATADLSDYCRRLLVPFYEYLTLRAENVGVKGLSVEFAGWGVVDMADRFDPTKAARIPQRTDNPNTPGVGGDVLVGNIEYQSRDGKLDIRLGRQFLFIGAPYSTQFDGLFARYTFPLDLSLTVYGGGATPREADAGRDAINPMFGGRVAWSRLDRAGLGLSFVEEMTTSGDLVRRQAGVDAFAILPKHIDVYGSMLLGMACFRDIGIQDAMLVASWMPTPRFKLSLDYSYLVPAAIIPKDSIFSVFSDSFYHDAGLDAYFRPTPRLKLSVQLKVRVFSDGSQGWLSGAGGRYLLGDKWRQVIGVDVQRLFAKNDNLEHTGFYQARLYGSVEPLPRLYLTADLYYFHFDGATWGPNDAATGAGTVRDAGSMSVIAGYRITSTMDGLLSLTANFNPASRYETIFLGRFVWHTWLESQPTKVKP